MAPPSKIYAQIIMRVCIDRIWLLCILIIIYCSFRIALLGECNNATARFTVDTFNFLVVSTRIRQLTFSLRSVETLQDHLHALRISKNTPSSTDPSLDTGKALATQCHQPLPVPNGPWHSAALVLHANVGFGGIDTLPNRDSYPPNDQAQPRSSGAAARVGGGQVSATARCLGAIFRCFLGQVCKDDRPCIITER